MIKSPKITKLMTNTKIVDDNCFVGEKMDIAAKHFDIWLSHALSALICFPVKASMAPPR